MIITVGKYQFNSEALGAYTEESFRETYKGKVDLEKAVKLMSKHFKDVQEPKESSKKRNKSKDKGTFSDNLYLLTSLLFLSELTGSIDLAILSSSAYRFINP